MGWQTWRAADRAHLQAQCGPKLPCHAFVHDQREARGSQPAACGNYHRLAAEVEQHMATMLLLGLLQLLRIQAELLQQGCGLGTDQAEHGCSAADIGDSHLCLNSHDVGRRFIGCRDLGSG